MAKKNNIRLTNEGAIKDQLKSVDTQLVDNVFMFVGPLTIAEFAKSTNLKLNEVVGYFFKQGKMYNANHTLTEDLVVELCLQFSFDFKKETQVDASNFMDEVVILDEEKHLTTRPPIITVMGHVDHGKTTLIDKIRNSDITKGESGGITQHTGAYQIKYKKKKITFLDTPGHEAFTSMRSRGAKLTDIVILVVAADDGVMPQTKEAIDHAKDANVPIIVFVNKMDKPGADIEKIKADLSKEDIVSEEWGGDYQFVFGSALNGDGIDKLFEAINIQAEMLELTANENRQAIGVVIESHIDKGHGATTTLIVLNGTLQKNDFIVAGSIFGKIKTLKDAHGEEVTEIKPGEPAIVTGLKNLPEPGDKFYGFVDEKFAKNLAEEKLHMDKRKELISKTTVQTKEGVNVINIIVKSDVQGTAEAVKHSLIKVENEEYKVHIVSSSVGNITKNDIALAVASNSIIYSFHIKASKEISNLAKQEDIEIKEHTIIYKMIEELESLLLGKMAPKYEKKSIGTAQVAKVIPASKIGNIAGSIMTSGKVVKDCFVEVYRNEELIHEGKLDSLQRGPDAVKEVVNGKDFGCHIHKFDDIKEGDVLNFFIEERVN